MYGYIYKTTNLVNGKIYIGQHKAEKFEPNAYKGSGSYFLEAYKTFGKQNFLCELIEECDSKEDLDNRERYWINFFDCRNPNVGYNRSEGGQSKHYFTNCKHTEEEREKISQSSKDRILIHKGNINKNIKKYDLDEYLSNGWIVGAIKRDLSDDEKLKIGKIISANKKGKHYYTNGSKIKFISDDQILEYEKKGYFPGQDLHDWYWLNFNGEDYKIKKEDYLEYKLKGYKNGRVTKGVSSQGRIELSKKLKGLNLNKKRSPESIKKFSDKMKGHTVSNETRQKISNTLKTKNKNIEQQEKLKLAAKKGLETRRKNGTLKRSEETKKKLSEIRLKSNGMRGKHPIKIVVIKDNIKKTVSINNKEWYIINGYKILDKGDRNE